MMKNRLIQYAVGIFVGISIYRLIAKHEDWTRSIILAGLIAVTITLIMYFYYSWKNKKSA